MTNERMEELRILLDAHRTALIDRVARVPSDMRSTPPAEERWSVVQVLHHLSLVESMITQGLEQIAANAAPRTSESQLTPMKDLSRIALRSRSVTAVPGSEPAAHITEADAWRALDAARPRLLGVMERLAVLDVDGKTFPHPIIGPLDSSEWIAFVGWHEARHTDQVREIGEQLDGQLETR